MNKKKQILKTKLKSYVEPNYSNNNKDVCAPFRYLAKY